MKILMVLTSNNKFGDTGEKTGFWLEEFAAPYYVFKDEGVDVTLASPKGGHAPVDPKSEQPNAQTEYTRRFHQDQKAQDALANTVKLSNVSAADYDAVFYPGGHGPLWDLAEDQHSIALVEDAWAKGKVVSAVCHGPVVFRHTKAADGSPLVKDKSVTGFSNTEEAAVGLTEAVPFLLEDMLKQNGAKYKKAENWKPFAVVDGKLVTGQNPASSEGTAWLVLDQLVAELSAQGQEKRDAALASQDNAA